MDSFARNALKGVGFSATTETSGQIISRNGP